MQASAADPQLERFQPPGFSVERSRHQVLGRTGFRGAGQSTRFIYGGPGKAYASEKAALAAAKKWVANERAKQGL